MPTATEGAGDIASMASTSGQSVERKDSVDTDTRPSTESRPSDEVCNCRITDDQAIHLEVQIDDNFFRLLKEGTGVRFRFLPWICELCQSPNGKRIEPI